MKITTFKVTVNETKEAQTFDTIESARTWADHCRRTHGVWGGEVTFKCEKTTIEEVAL
jgi:hypothetical protein